MITAIIKLFSLYFNFGWGQLEISVPYYTTTNFWFIIYDKKQQFLSNALSSFCDWKQIHWHE